MYCNLVTLIINVILCMIGLHYYKSLSAVNYSVFTSFLIFHIIQDIILFKKGIVTIYKIVSFYVILILFYFVYTELSAVFNTMKLFLIFWSSILFISAFLYFFINKNHFHKKVHTTLLKSPIGLSWRFDILFSLPDILSHSDNIFALRLFACVGHISVSPLRYEGIQIYHRTISIENAIEQMRAQARRHL